MTFEERQQKLQEITVSIAKCTKCPLYLGTNPVPGEGNPEAEVIFIGEAPGFHEDKIGRPFVGVSGKLLDESLATIGLNRSSVWIGNMIKHRPPENRDPLPIELVSCKIYLDQQLKVIRPRFVVTLGRFAMEKFIANQFISKVHGQQLPVTWEGNTFLLFPMYHPAAALRGTGTMNEFKSDFLKLGQLLKNTPSASGVREDSVSLSSDIKKDD